MGSEVDSSSKPIKKVLILIAMEAEAAPLLKALELEADDPPRIKPPAPCVSFSGHHFGLELHVVSNGKCLVFAVDNVGTVPAALTSYLAIQEFQPDLVISMGTAGGFKARGATIGDVFVGTSTMNHDRRIPIPGFDKYGIGAYEAVPTPNMLRELGLKDGVVSSGNSLDYTQEDMKLMNDHGVAIKEMEAAAIAWASHMFGVPMFCLKAVTDIVDGDRAPQDEFLENLQKAARSLQETLPKVLQFVAGKTVDQL